MIRFTGAENKPFTITILCRMIFTMDCPGLQRGQHFLYLQLNIFSNKIFYKIGTDYNRNK